MQSTVMVGKRLIPIGHIALVEPLDAAALERLESQRPFQTRLVMLDRSSVLAEDGFADFAKHHGFRQVDADGIALNPTIAFKVEAFEPSGEFQPAKPYRSRLLWHDPQGQMQSRLMVTEPEALLSIAVRAANGNGKRMAGGPRKPGIWKDDPQPV